MSEAVRGIYRNGVIEPIEPLKIAEGAEVYVTVQRRRSREELLGLLTKLKERGVIENIPARNSSRLESRAGLCQARLSMGEGRDNALSRQQRHRKDLYQ